MMNRLKSVCAGTFAILAVNACSTTTVVEEKTPLPVVPEYVKVPHPPGFDLADLRSIFISPLAPKGVLGEFADTCDDEFKKLLDATESKEDRQKGAVELVTQDPERMHWCFYSKISRLQDVLQGDSTWSQRQKRIIEAYGFLSPVANSFLSTYHDSRYLRWATQYYQKVSEWVFFKKLEPTAENTLLLTTGTKTELEPWVPVRKEEEHASVFEKYGISFMPTVAGAVNPFEAKDRAPASVVEEKAVAVKAESVKPETATSELPPEDPFKVEPAKK